MVDKDDQKTCDGTDLHVGHWWGDDYGFRWYCFGVIACPVQSWNANADCVVKYEKALDAIKALHWPPGEPTARAMWNIARDALGHG